MVRRLRQQTGMDKQDGIPAPRPQKAPPPPLLAEQWLQGLAQWGRNRNRPSCQSMATMAQAMGLPQKWASHRANTRIHIDDDLDKEADACPTVRYPRADPPQADSWERRNMDCAKSRHSVVRRKNAQQARLAEDRRCTREP